MKTAKQEAKLNDYEKDEHGYFKIVDGKKIYQIEEKTERDKELNDTINSWRASGMSIKDFLNRGY